MNCEIIFESHATSTDNAEKRASGHNDPPLSKKGIREAIQLGLRYQQMNIAIVYCSDLKRSYETAHIAFGPKRIPIVADPRLREWNYGTFNGEPTMIVESMKFAHIQNPFDQGESLIDAYERTLNLLRTISSDKVLIIGHRATYYTLEYLSSKKSFEEILKVDWIWQPGWKYRFSKMCNLEAFDRGF